MRSILNQSQFFLPGTVPSIAANASVIRRVVSVTLLTMVMVAAEPARAQTGTCDWIGGSGSDWHTAANWDCDQHDGVPTADDAVVIAPGGATTVDLAADGEAFSLELGIDDGSTSHSETHQLLTSVDEVTLNVGGGGIFVRQTGYFQPGRRQIFGVGSQSPIRATVNSSGGVLVHGRLFPRNTTIFADVVLDRPVIGGARGYIQARGWNNVHGQVHVIDGFVQPVVPGGHHGTPAPHLRMVDHDLIVEDGSSVQIFADPGTFDAPAIAVDGGIFDHRGNLTTSSFTNSANAPIVIDAAIVNQGRIRTRLARPPGLAFQGPEGTVHQNSGEIVVGDLFGSDIEADAVNGFGLLVESGRSLHNTGTVEIHRLRTAEGEVANTSGGLITDVTEVTGTGAHVLGFAGTQAVEIEIVDTGTIERLHMIWHGEDHPDAALHPNIEGTNHWWDLAATTADDNPASGDLSLRLPRLTPNVPRICRYVESPADWACLQTALGSTHATATGLSTLSNWALADLSDQLFSDRFE